MDALEGLSLLSLPGRSGEVSNHAVAVEAAHGLVLVDAGLPGSVDGLSEALRSAGYHLGDVSTLVLTHGDAGHAGGASAVVDRANPVVAVHEDEVPYVEGEVVLNGEDRVGSAETPAVRVDLAVTDGTWFDTAAGRMRVVATPGHTPGHASLYLPDSGLLIAGDALRARDGLAAPDPETTLDVQTAAGSIARLATFDVSTVVCSKGGAVAATGDDLRAVAVSMHSQFPPSNY
jgi:glyoxylase-like metal-dependent hydrolase (beta-lactamase superfamily II)